MNIYYYLQQLSKKDHLPNDLSTKPTIMMTHLSWKKGILSSSYVLFSGSSAIGVLKENTWSQSAEGMLNNKKYHFRTSGFFSPYTLITDLDSNTVVGKITYNAWRTKATIMYKNKVFEMSYQNMWNSKWMVFDREGMRLDYQGSSTKGSVSATGTDELLLLAGLFISNYYWQTSIAIMVAVFVPLYVTLLS